MAARDWFGTVETDRDPSCKPFYEGVVALVERIRPAEMNTITSTITVTPSSIDLTIVHRSDPDATITMQYEQDDFGSSQSIIEKAEEYYRINNRDTAVKDQMLEELEFLLTRVYIVERSTWRGKPALHT